MTKQIFITLAMLFLMLGVASAVDFQMVGLSVSPSSVTTNQNVTAYADVALRISSQAQNVIVRFDFGNGNVVDQTVTIQPNSQLRVTQSAPYANPGIYTVTATVDPTNTVQEDVEGNNAATAQVTVQAQPSAQLSAANLELGSTEQERDQQLTQTIRVTNSGNQDVTVNLTASIPQKYNAVIGENNVLIGHGLFHDFPVTITVPEDQSSGRSQIGTILVTTNTGLSASSQVFLTTKSDLVFSKVKVETQDKSKTFDNGESMTVKPGDKATLTVTVKNDYDTSVTIEDINLKVTSDGDIDLDEDTDLNDLDEGDKDTQTYTFDIPSDADGNQNIDLRVTGRDENGARHEARFSLTLDVQKKNNEIAIPSITITPQHAMCGDRVSVKTTIENIGSNDQDDVTLIDEIGELDIYQRWSNIVLNEGDTTSKTLTFTVRNSTEPGDYVLTATSYYNGDTESNDAQAVFTVDPCNPSSGNTGNTGGNTGSNNGGTGGSTGNNGNAGSSTNYTQPPIIIPTGNTAGPSYGTSFFNSEAYIIVLAAVVLVLLVLIIVLLVKFVF